MLRDKEKLQISFFRKKVQKRRNFWQSKNIVQDLAVIFYFIFWLNEEYYIN